ncbi:MAG: thiamine phosphate synthase, partial [Chloroflexi bacterium]|nr:thiamine phosphate synthase [Chloroflexota bacterium]
EAVSVPVVAIGGINLDNVGPVIDAGADAVCVISAVLSAPDMEVAAQDLVSRIASHQSLR